LLAGAAIGIVISAIALFKLFPMVYPTLAQLEPMPALATPVVASEETTVRAPQFDFYSLLPEIEVSVLEVAKPVPEITTTPPTTKAEATLATEVANNTEVTTTNAAHYRLQFASFRHYKDADSLKAQMALAGIQVEIEAVTLGPKDTWYRVRSNLYPSRESAESAKSQFQARSIQTVLLEEKG
jgi:cell division protein FtsN